MKTKASGFSLISLVAALPLILSVFALAGLTTRMLIVRGPALRQRGSTYTSLRHLAATIEKDVADIDSEAPGALSVEPDRCVLGLAGGPVEYRIGEDEVLRAATDPDGAEHKSRWAIPGGRIRWELKNLAGGVRGLGLTISADGFDKQKLRPLTNSYLLLVDKEAKR